MYRNLVKSSLILSLITLILLLIAPNAAQALIVPAGLNPGDQYHLVFVTEGTRDATSSVIGPYNTFVQDEAERAGTLTENFGIDWFVIGSTLSTDARDNAIVGANVPVYLLDGTTKIADGFADMWDGDIDNPIDVDQFGNSVSGLVITFTGTDSAGFAKKNPSRYLGFWQGNIGTGRTSVATDGWIADGGTSLKTNLQSFYALSELLTVPIPEPATGSLIVGGMLALFWRLPRKP